MDQLQALVNGMSMAWKAERAKTQMTLGKLIAALEVMPADALIDGIADPDSYRGYYEDLAFSSIEKKVTVADALKMCRDAMGQVFYGYKGGEYVMGALTPLWIAEYGCCGRKFMALTADGVIETAEDD